MCLSHVHTETSCFALWSETISWRVEVSPGNPGAQREKMDALLASHEGNYLENQLVFEIFEGKNWHISRNNVGNIYTWNLHVNWFLFWWDDWISFSFRVTSCTTRRVIWVLGKSDNTSWPITCTCISACILTSAYFGGCTIDTDTCYTCSHHIVPVATINSMNGDKFQSPWCMDTFGVYHFVVLRYAIWSWA